MENGKVGTGGSGRVSVAVMAGASLAGVRAGGPGGKSGAAVPGLGGWLVLVVGDEGQLGVVRGQPRQGGCDGVAGREGVAADDVDGHELGTPGIAGDPGVAGVAGGAKLADMSLEVLGAD